MSGGTPVGANLMRQRHSWGYASSGEDLEDDACSKPMPSPPSIPRAKTWIEIMENVLWIGSAVFIIYFGDWHSNLIYLLWHDDRIRRSMMIGVWGLAPGHVTIFSAFFRAISLNARLAGSLFIITVSGSGIPLYLGFGGVLLSAAYFFYTSFSTSGVRKLNEDWDILGASGLPLVTLLGLASFCLFTWALWPIWSFLTLPLVFTLFMACMVISPYLISGTIKKPPPEVLRLD